MPSRLRVLVIEDDPALRKVLEIRLELDGFDVTVAPDGEAALEVLLDFHPDVVISDLMMPRLDGIGFCREARTRPGMEHLPIVLLTAHQRDCDVEDILRQLGGIVYMGKPFDAGTRSRTLRGLVDGASAARA